MWAAGSEAAGEDGRVRQGLQLERALKGMRVLYANAAVVKTTFLISVCIPSI